MSNLTTKAEIIKWVSEYGRKLMTPCYVYVPRDVVANYVNLRSALGTHLLLSVKACPNPEILSRVANLCDGVEVASRGELSNAIGTPGEIFVNSPGSDKDLLCAAIASKATPVLDSLAQFEVYTAQPSHNRSRSIMLRLNPCALDVFSGGRKFARREDHFGLDWNDALEVAMRARAANVSIYGFHVFRGSFSFGRDSVDFADAARKLVDAFYEMTGEAPSILNLGGGFDERWSESLDLVGTYSRALQLMRFRSVIYHESGRAIFSPAGYFLTRVVYTKQLLGREIIVCDGGLSHNFLLAKTEAVMQKHQTPMVLAADSTIRRRSSENTAMVVGPSCSNRDIIGALPSGSDLPNPGDVCIFENCGAYNANYTMPAFLTSRPAGQYILSL